MRDVQVVAATTFLISPATHQREHVNAYRRQTNALIGVRVQKS
jgi:hypothetical protein